MIPVKRRRILEKIKIDEISAVDKPAMEDALVTIMKRAGADDELISTTWKMLFWCCGTGLTS